MLNYIWGGMIIIGILYGSFTGHMASITTEAISSAKEAVSLCITMLGVMSMWMGLMEIAEKSGLLSRLSIRLNGIINFLFPEIPRENASREYIATNMAANLLGLGWAATPAGLKAMEELAKLNKKKKTASNSMCTLLVINISSLQLIPVNMMAYRSQYGSANPAAIIAPGIIATFISTIVAVIFCRIMQKKN